MGNLGINGGEEGKCYPYTPNDKESKERAKEKAEEQGRAIQANDGEMTLYE